MFKGPWQNSQSSILPLPAVQWECAAYGGVTAPSVMEDAYENPQ